MGISISFFRVFSKECWSTFHVFEVLFLIVVERGNKAHWVNPFQISKHNYVKAFKTHVCLKIEVVIRFIQRDTKVHWHQKCSLIFLHCSQCLPEMFSFKIMVCSHSFKKHYMLMPLQNCKVFYIFDLYFQGMLGRVENFLVATHFCGSGH